MDNKAKALAEYLDIEVGDIKNSYGNQYNTPKDGDYLVVTEDEAQELAVESIIELMDDVGAFGLSDNISSWIMDEAIDESWFEDEQKEYHESYIEELQNEPSSDDTLYANGFHEELVQYGLMEEFDMNTGKEMEEYEEEAEDLVDSYLEEVTEEDSVEWYRNNFGDEDLEAVVKKYNLIDLEVVAEYIIESDGLGNTLAGYDNNENYQNDFNIYRV